MQYAVYYRHQYNGKMSMYPIKADTPELAETEFLTKVFGFVQYWVTTEHISSKRGTPNA